MRVSSFLPATLLLATTATTGFALTPVVHTSRTRSHASSQQANIKHTTGHTTAHKSVRTSVATTHHDTVGMPSERATEIQNALIQHGYLTGEPSGTWDKETAAAMEKLQSDNGWQTKITPDSRALIKLGLGPQSSTSQPSAPPR